MPYQKLCYIKWLDFVICIFIITSVPEQSPYNLELTPEYDTIMEIKGNWNK